VNELTGHHYCAECGNGQNFIENYCSRCGKNTAEQIVIAVLTDLEYRSGDWLWREIDEDVQGEIKGGLLQIVQNILEEAARD